MKDAYTHFCDERDAELYGWEKSRPICTMCREHIMDEFAYDIEGEFLCEDCFDEYKKRFQVDLEYWEDDGYDD